MSSKAQEALKEQAKTCHASIEWWKKEMSALIKESDILEENPEEHSDFEERMDNIRAKMNYLLFKGEWENKQLFILQDKINKFESEKPFENFELVEKNKRKKKK
jgi:1,2-phenylacetyl-CoA epoxidase PaaB subunit